MEFPVTTGVPTGIVSVVRAPSTSAALVIAEGVLLGGVDAVEIAFTVTDAASVIASLRARTSIPIGAGTVRTIDQCRAAAAAGATFVVAPDLDVSVVNEAHRLGLAAIPGALTPTEVGRCVAAGADAVKLFPVGSVGGPRYVRTIAEPFPGTAWVVSGGITVPEIAAYRAAGVRAICLGSALIDREAALRGDVELIARKTRTALLHLDTGG